MLARLHAHRRRIVICGSAALTLVAVEAAVRHVAPSLRSYYYGIYDRAAHGLAAADRPDIVILGSSRVRFGLDPTVFEEVLGRKTYNAGISNSKVVEWNVLARRLFTDAPPRLVVLGINAGEVRGDYLPTEAARHLFDFNDLVESVRADGPSLDVVGAFARRTLGPLWKTYDARFEILSWSHERLAVFFPKHAQLARELRARIATPVPPGGYDHPWSHGRRLKSLEQKAPQGTLEVAEVSVPAHRPDGFTFARLQTLLKWLDQRGIRVVVAYVPNSPRAEARWNQVEPAIIARIADVCRQSGVAFLHWDQSELPRTDADYLDETHLGWPIAREISRRIAEEIKTLALLDHPARDQQQVASTEDRP